MSQTAKDKFQFIEWFSGYYDCYDSISSNDEIEEVLNFLCDKRSILDRVRFVDDIELKDISIVIVVGDVDYFNDDYDEMSEESLKLAVKNKERTLRDFIGFIKTLEDEPIYVKIIFPEAIPSRWNDIKFKDILTDDILSDILAGGRIQIIGDLIDDALDNKDFKKVKKLLNEKQKLQKRKVKW